LSASEFSLLTAMCEHCSDGSTIWAAIPRLAAYSKLSERNVQLLIRSFCSRGILSQLAPANTAKRRPTTYRINESALVDDPRMTLYRMSQKKLPGIHIPPIPGEPVAEPNLVKPLHQSDETIAPNLVKPLHQSGETSAPDSKSLDSKPLDSKPTIQHGDAALNSLPAWLAFKEQLREELPAEEYALWAEPLKLLKAMSSGIDKKHLLAAIPRNARIQSAACKRLPMMRELLAPAGLNISLTRYPDEWEIAEANKRYGIDMATRPWTRDGSA
jgi:hypothetical protein